MPARGHALCVAAWLILYSGHAAAQTQNPHSAIPAPQQTGPAMRPGVQRGPGNPPSAVRVPTQAGGSTQVPQTPTPPANQTPPAPQTADVPQRPAQMPAKPSRVSYVGGQLTVVADNSTLNDVLNGIRNAAGIKMEGLAGSTDRVFGQFGPASPRVVIDSLLNGSHYDFIILSSLDTPDTVQRVILSPRGSSPTGAVAASNQGRPFNRPPPEEDNDVAGNPDEVTDEQPVGAMPSQGIQPGQPVQAVQPGQAAPINPASVPGQNQQQSGTQNVKTPEQLLEELRRLNSNQRQNQGGETGPRTPMQPPDIVPR